MSLRYRKVRQLSLVRGAHPRGRTFLSAASGLVRVRERLYVIADDELHLGVFDVGSAKPLRLVRVFEGRLPADAKKRKKKKPDLESLLLLPSDTDSPGGALLALGSGSRPNRFVGALLRVDAFGDAKGPARPVDLEPLYRPLVDRFDELNIEGAFVAGGSLVVLQRGVAGDASAVVRFDLAKSLDWLGGRRRRAPRPTSVRSVDLGAVDGVDFAFTDGAALADGSWAFSAVAEARDNSVDDGPCVASAIGVCDGDDKLLFIEHRRAQAQDRRRRGEPRRRSAAAQRRHRRRRPRATGRARCRVVRSRRPGRKAPSPRLTQPRHLLSMPAASAAGRCRKLPTGVGSLLR